MAYVLLLVAGRTATRVQAARPTIPVLADGEGTKTGCATTVREPAPELEFVAGTALVLACVHWCRGPSRRS